MTTSDFDPNEISQHRRGDGSTTRQMQAAARGAYFVIPSSQSEPYMRHLAHHLGRRDLKFVGPDFFNTNRWRGLTLSQVVVDHSVLQHMSYDQRIRLYEAFDKMKRV